LYPLPGVSHHEALDREPFDDSRLVDLEAEQESPFLRGQKHFGRVYFSDLAGSGLGGLSFLGALYLLPPERLLLVPMALWFLGALTWFLMQRDRLALLGRQRGDL